MAVGVIGLSDHSSLAEGLSSPGGSGCGFSPPATCLVSSGVSTAGLGNGSRLRAVDGSLSIVVSSKRRCVMPASLARSATSGASFEECGLHALSDYESGLNSAKSIQNIPNVRVLRVSRL
jgi:hypothetical protein